MAKAKNIKKGQKFGYLTILEELPPSNKKRVFLTQCICGKIKHVRLGNLLNGTTKSCGCMKAKKHGMSHTQIYKVWQTMVYRCEETKKSGAWKNYGKKGIRVCKEWQGTHGFVAFYEWSIKNGYKEEKLPSGKNKYTIDRIDGKKGYCPSNCRWVDYETQCCNLSMLKTNKSGYRGVSWSKTEKKWVCVISINNQSKRIGAYKTQKEAVEARNKFIDDNNLPHQKNKYRGELSYGY